MAFRCSSCNGSMVFDPASQMMRCQHCGTSAEPAVFSVRDMASTIFTCQNCGAELEATDDSYVGFCPYCDGQSILPVPGGEQDVPDTVLPFRISKEQCKERYTTYLKRIPCVPRAFKDEGQIEKFVGIYTPWYAYNAEIKRVEIPTKKAVRSTSEYTEYEHNLTEIGVEGRYEGAPFDGSDYLDDDIAQGILPFDIRNEKAYNPAYISGFYADVANVDAQTYADDAEERMTNDVLAHAKNYVLQENGLSEDDSGEENVFIEATDRHFRKVLFPLWFLTYRDQDRLAYGVVNGDSGAIVSDVPVDMRSFYLMVLAVSAVLFVLMELLIQPVAQIVTILSMVISSAVLWVLKNNYEKIAVKDLHLNDKGYRSSHKTEEAAGHPNPMKSLTKFKGSKTMLIGLIAIAAYNLFPIVIRSASSFLEPETLRRFSMLIGLACFLLAAIAGAGIRKWAAMLRNPLWILPVLLVALSLVVNIALAFSRLASDLWYYGGALLCMGTTFFALTQTIRTYNRSTTRPIPRLSDRQEV